MKEAIFDDAACARYDADGLAVPEWAALVAQLEAMREARAALRGAGAAGRERAAEPTRRVNHAASADRKVDGGSGACDDGRHGITGE